MRRWSTVVVAAVMLAGCGTPDVARFTTTATSTTAASSSSSSGSISDESSYSSVPPSSSVAGSTDPAAALGVNGVVPWGFVTQADIDKAIAMVGSMTVEEKAGSVIMANSADVVGSTEIADLGLGGLNLLGTKGVLAGTKGGTPAQVAAVISGLAAQVPAAQSAFALLVGVDQEYGDVTRLINGFTDLPGASEFGGIRDLPTAVELTKQAAEVAAAEMAAVGFNIDFAPVSDVLPGRGSSAIGDRSYGTDPARVAALVTAAVQGYQGGGIAATLKHFPGIGGISADSHLVLSTVTTSCDTWNGAAAAPVRAGVEAGVSLVMTGHALFPAVDPGEEPTSLSEIVVSQLLRGNPATPLAGGCIPIGFRGLALSDSQVMEPIANSYSTGEAAWRSLVAGEDVVLMPGSPVAARDGIVGAVADGQLAETRLNEASVRVFALRSALVRTPRPGLDTVNSADHRAVARTIRAAIG